MTQAEARELAQLARGKRVLEVGAQFGFSTVLMARENAWVWSVDHHRGDPDSGHQDSLAQYLHNLRGYGMDYRVVSILADWREVIGVVDLRLFGLIFLDAEHDADSETLAIF